jgi:hypothetical protein
VILAKERVQRGSIEWPATDNAQPGHAARAQHDVDKPALCAAFLPASLGAKFLVNLDVIESAEAILEVL